MIKLDINGKTREFDLGAEMPLLWALRDAAQMTGTKCGCGKGLYGACTVHVDGVAVRSCTVAVASLAGKRITTIEGISASAAGRATQAAWLAHEVVQCGYCQSGQILAAAALLMKNPNPSDADIDAVMSGNVCRCGTYSRIREAIKEAAKSLLLKGA